MVFTNLGKNLPYPLNVRLGVLQGGDGGGGGFEKKLIAFTGNRNPALQSVAFHFTN
jgi:hypothetical protein